MWGHEFSPVAKADVRVARDSPGVKRGPPERLSQLPKGHATPDVLWRFALAARPRDLHAMLVDGRIVFSDGGRRVQAVDAVTGRAVWSIEASVSGLSYRADTVYLSEKAGYITAVAAANGAVRWRFDTGGEAAGRAIATDTAVYGLSHYANPESATWSSYLWALDHGGRETVRVVREDRYLSPSFFLGDKRLYVMSGDGAGNRVLGINASTGEEVWRSDIALPGAIVAYFEGTLIVNVPKKSALAAFRPVDSGTPVWVHETGRKWTGRPVLVGGRLYAPYFEKTAQGVSTAHLVALDIETGKEVWRVETGSWKPVSSPGVADGVACVGRIDGSLLGIDTVRGATKWRYAPPQKVDRIRVGALDCHVASDRVYAWDARGHLFAIDAAAGKLEWATLLPREVEHLIARGGVAYAFVDDRVLYALK